MKLFVDGIEVELESPGAHISKTEDRLIVRAKVGTSTAVSVRQGDAVLVSYRGRQYRVEKKRPRGSGAGAAASGELRAPMPGVIVEVFASEGAEVRKGDKIIVLEAMKTQQPFTAPFDGILSRVGVQKGQQVVDGAVLAVVKPHE